MVRFGLFIAKQYIDAAGHIEELPLMTKAEVADRILDRLVVLLREKPPISQMTQIR